MPIKTRKKKAAASLLDNPGSNTSFTASARNFGEYSAFFPSRPPCGHFASWKCPFFSGYLTTRPLPTVGSSQNKGSNAEITP